MSSISRTCYVKVEWLFTTPSCINYQRFYIIKVYWFSGMPEVVVVLHCQPALRRSPKPLGKAKSHFCGTWDALPFISSRRLSKYRHFSQLLPCHGVRPNLPLLEISTASVLTRPNLIPVHWTSSIINFVMQLFALFLPRLNSSPAEVYLPKSTKR